MIFKISCVSKLQTTEEEAKLTEMGVGVEGCEGVRREGSKATILMKTLTTTTKKKKARQIHDDANDDGKEVPQGFLQYILLLFGPFFSLRLLPPPLLLDNHMRDTGELRRKLIGWFLNVPPTCKVDLRDISA